MPQIKDIFPLVYNKTVDNVFLELGLPTQTRDSICYSHAASFSSFLRRKGTLWRRCLFPFRKRSLPFLTVDAIIGNQAFCHGRCNICSGLSHNKVTNTFLNSLRKNKV